MYNAHRGMVQPPNNNNNNNNNNRLSELFEQIRREFDIHAQDRAGEHDQNSKFACLPIAYRKLVKCTLPLLCCWKKNQTLSSPRIRPGHLPRTITREAGKKTTESALMAGRLTKVELAVASQMQEMELVRQKVYELERNQIQIKQRYLLVALEAMAPVRD